MKLHNKLAIALLAVAAALINPPIIPDVSAMPRPAQWFIGLLVLIVTLIAAAWLRQRPQARPSTTRAAVVALSLVFATAFCWPLLEHLGDASGRNDWDQHLMYHWVPYETLQNYGQVPLWNPFMCGGLPMLGNPQSRWFSPFFLLHLWLGPELAIQFEIIAHIALAWLGVFVLGRIFGLSRLAAVMPAGVFAGCSAFYLRLAEGQTGTLSYAYLPWILAAAAFGRPLIAGALLALAIGEGGIYSAPHAALALGLLAMYRSLKDRSTRPLVHLALTATMAACLAAPKLLIVHEWMSRYPRLIDSAEAMHLNLLVDALFWRIQDLNSRPFPDAYGFHEYGAYLGPLAAGLVLVGIWTRPRAAAPWLLLALLGLGLALGSALGGNQSPWALLHALPLFASQHVPSRFLMLAVLALGMLAGVGLDGFARDAGRWRTIAAVVLLGASSFDAALVGPRNLAYISDGDIDVLPSAAHFIQFRDSDSRRMYSIARANMGALNCYEPLQPETEVLGINDAGYRGEQYLLGGGKVTLVDWSPSRLVIDVVAARPDLLIVNQNHDSSWRVVAGRGEVEAHGGLIAVRVPSGAQQLTLAYRSPRFAAGLVMACVALTAAATRAIVRRRRKRSGSPLAR